MDRTTSALLLCARALGRGGLKRGARARASELSGSSARARKIHAAAAAAADARVRKARLLSDFIGGVSCFYFIRGNSL